MPVTRNIFVTSTLTQPINRFGKQQPKLIIGSMCGYTSETCFWSGSPKHAPDCLIGVEFADLPVEGC